MKDVIIKIVGTQNFGQGDDDSIELITDGKYSYADGSCEISYEESPVTGLEGTNTFLSITPTDVTLRREGMMTSSTVFKPGERSAFLYNTPYGSATLGVDTRKIISNFDEHGGDMTIDYVMDMDHAVFGKNQFKINVREQEIVL